MNVRDALRVATERLAQTSMSARLDAELLMAYAMGESRDAVLLRRSDDDAPPKFEALVQRRLNHEPLAYIVQSREFWSLDFSVGPGVLIPRPDSETLLETALRALAGRPPSTILDLGTGSGALLLSALTEWPAAKGVGIDQSDTALAYARKNAERLGLVHALQLHVVEPQDHRTVAAELANHALHHHPALLGALEADRADRIVGGWEDQLGEGGLFVQGHP